MFQMLFAAISPLLMTGSFAGRFRFWPWLAFTVLWELLVYYPVAHWVWGGGFLQRRGVIDFAGGIVVHATSGAGALVTATMLGRRENFELHENGEFPPSNLPLAVTGTGLLFIGWFGFNAGSALQSGALATSTVMSTQIGGCVSAVTWLVVAAISSGGYPPGVVAVSNGGIAGLAGITPASGYIDNRGTLALGVIIGLATYGGVVVLKKRARIDDALDVSIVHGLSGIIGTIATGFLATRTAHPGLAHQGLLYGGGSYLLRAQLEGAAICFTYSLVMTAGLLWVINKVWMHTTGRGVRVSVESERLGLDMTEHRETAYHELEAPVAEEHKAMLPNHYGDPQVTARRRSSWLPTDVDIADDVNAAQPLINS